MSNAAATETLTSTQDQCRAALAAMAFNRSVVADSVPASVRKELESRGLVAEHTDGLLALTSRANGYAHDPSTFEL